MATYTVGGNVSSGAFSPQTAMLDTFFPGFSLVSAAIYKYLHVDVTLYIPALLSVGMLVFAMQYASDYLWEKMESHFMSSAEIRVDDELYNMVLPWIANQDFAKTSRRFVPNTNLNSRNWMVWHFSRDDDDTDEDESTDTTDISSSGHKKKNKPLQYTPSFGTHYFWYKGRLLVFKRSQAQQQQSYMPVSEREEISVSCFGRDPSILKALLDECRSEYIKNDENRTLIYRGSVKPGTTEPVWTRCMSRVSRPFSTVVLDEAVKKSLLGDIQEYLDPWTRRWYGNRGIPYRRGYLLYGPPGTGKSSLCFAVAGYFKLKIYIVSLNSPAMNEENLATLFAELPRRCIVLLEDIDTAGLTHTRQAPDATASDAVKEAAAATATTPVGTTTLAVTAGKISLSALLNVIDGVTSQEGRLLFMTTNHVDKLDEALIRPGRVDLTVKFDLADNFLVKTLFKGIFATLDEDFPKSVLNKKGMALSGVTVPNRKLSLSGTSNGDSDEHSASSELAEKEVVAKKMAEEARISALADKFAVFIPEATFSPAEIQGFLLKHKRDPAAAVEGATVWVKETLARKEEFKKRQREKEEKEAEEAKKKEEEMKAKEEKDKEEKEKDKKEGLANNEEGAAARF